MSSLYRLDAPADRIAARFHADQGKDPWQGGYVAPGGFAPVILRGRDRTRLIAPRLWGVPPPGAGGMGARPVIHARNLESPFWIGTLRHSERRCLVPATSFQIWSSDRNGPEGRRHACWLHVPAEPLFAFAGIWKDGEIPSFALLVTDPNRLVAAIRPSAMPLIIPAEYHDDWLAADWKTAARLVQPFPAQKMAMTEGEPPAPHPAE